VAGGEEHAEGAAVARGGVDLDGAAEAGDDAVADGEAEAGASPVDLRREERREDGADVLGRNAVAVVLDGDLDAAVRAATAAFQIWSRKPIKERVQVFFRYKFLLEKNMEELARLVQEENGKTYSEAVAEVEKSIELTEFACSLPQLVTGEVLEVSRGVECRTEHIPLGVVASIVPFNFPSMVPNWTLPNAIALGNCMIMKPSEKVPLSTARLALLLKEAGLPDGVFNIVNGDSEIVNAICDHPGIEAVSFVGSTKVAKIVYQRATSQFKRALALGGAKNHLMVLPDAKPDMTAQNVAASMSGCAGQRCMAASAMLAVGEVDHIIEKICEEARKIVPGDNLGAVISKESKDRIEAYITEAEKQGAKILVDGRNSVVKGKEQGTYVGPTVIDFVKPEMSVAKEEIFGPVVTITPFETEEEVMMMANSTEYGLASIIWTENLTRAHRLSSKIKSGIVWINCWMLRDLRTPFGGVKNSGVGREGGCCVRD
jgi:malonate-semialdehyde dehydrogenase (acetylating)/methylmalonate-semialdehyde dehydrogenase